MAAALLDNDAAGPRGPHRRVAGRGRGAARRCPPQAGVGQGLLRAGPPGRADRRRRHRRRPLPPWPTPSTRHPDGNAAPTLRRLGLRAVTAATAPRRRGAARCELPAVVAGRPTGHSAAARPRQPPRPAVAADAGEQVRRRRTLDDPLADPPQALLRLGDAGQRRRQPLGGRAPGRCGLPRGGWTPRGRRPVWGTGLRSRRGRRGGPGRGEDDALDGEQPLVDLGEGDLDVAHAFVEPVDARL